MLLMRCENDPCQKMTSLHSVQDSKRVGRESLKRSSKLLSSAEILQKCLGEGSTRLLNDLKNHGNRILIFSHEKTFTVDPVF